MGLVLRQLGAQQDRLDKAKWHSKQGPISVTGAKFINWTSQVGGGGAIDLVMHLDDRGYRDAVQWLVDRFGTAAVNPATFRTVARNRPSANLGLPTRDDRKLRQVTRYLIDDCLCLSTAGARANPAWLPSFLRPGYTVHCGFDADATGDQMADAMMELHPTIHRLRPARHDWNDMLQATRR